MCVPWALLLPVLVEGSSIPQWLRAEWNLAPNTGLTLSREGASIPGSTYSEWA